MTTARSTYQRMPLDDVPVDLDLRLDLYPVRPYLDLEGTSGGPLHTRVLTHYANAVKLERAVDSPFQSNPSANTRWHILRETRLLPYHAAEPEGLARGLRGDRWQQLCERVRHWSEVPLEQRPAVAAVLTRLGFYGTVLSLVPHPEETAALDPWTSAMVTTRANALYKQDRGAVSGTLALLHLVYRRASSSRSRLAAAVALTVHHARVSKDAEQVGKWADRALADLDTVPEGAGSDQVLRSAVLRACSFAPFFKSDLARTEEMLDECERLAFAAPENTPELALLKAENLHAMFETRGRAAMRAGDRSQAIARQRQLTELDPEDGRVHRDLGYMLLAGEGPAAALPSFERAALLGPPFTAVAWCLVAHCHRELGDLPAALSAFLTASDLDPCSISALRGITDLAGPLGDQPLSAWARDRIDALTSPGATRTEARGAL